MELIDDLKIQLEMVKSSTEGRAVKLRYLPDNYPAWVVCVNEGYGVVVPCRLEGEFNNSFSNVTIRYLPKMIIDNEAHSVLFLSVSNKVGKALIEKFVHICYDFIKPGDNGENRESLINDPAQWWKMWKILIGNTDTDVSASSVIGELFTYRWLLKKGIKPEWTGGSRTRVDFTAGNKCYEVKTTTVRYENLITVHGQFQLQAKAVAEEYLVFCRVEPSGAGESIEDVACEIKNLGEDAVKIENELSRIGFPNGNYYRGIKYKILEMRKYTVDESFPRITPESFIGGKVPDGVIRIEYQVDLSNLPYETIE